MNPFRISCDTFEFLIAFPNASWGIFPDQGKYPWLISAPIALSWHDQNGRHCWSAAQEPRQVTGRKAESDFLQEVESLQLQWPSQERALEVTLEYTLHKALPSLQWCLWVKNASGHSIYLDRVTMLDTRRSHCFAPRSKPSLSPNPLDKHDLDSYALGFHGSKLDLGFYSNGWQAWNYAGVIGVEDRFPRSRLGPLHLPVQLNAGTPRPKKRGHAISDMFGILGDRCGKGGLIAGFLTQRQAFGTLECWLRPPTPWLRMWMGLDAVRLDPGQSYSTDTAWLSLVDLECADPLEAYLNAVASANHARRNAKSPVGWCSWYQYFENVTQANLVANLQWAKNHRQHVPLDVLQLDDGFEIHVGDWNHLKDGFPDSLEQIGKRIAEEDLVPGLWLAPFIAERNSLLARAQREWILRNRLGLPVNPGFLWNSFPFVLDVTHPEVLDHLKALVGSLVREGDYQYLKLDFLYAGALPGKHHLPTLTRAQALSRALETMREAAGEDVQLLGCGCPMGSGIGVFDAMRINPDVAPKWRPAYWRIEGLLRDELALPAARNALTTAINRLPLHQRWWINDPDCLLLRSKDSLLTAAEIQTLASVIAMNAGSLFVSDDLTRLEEERLDWLARLIPPLPQAARALDWFDSPQPAQLVLDLHGAIGSWKLVTLINWKDHPADLVFDLSQLGLNPSADFHLVDFWKEEYAPIHSCQMSFPNVPAHGVRTFSIRPASGGAQWVGDTLHFSQGLAINEWHADQRYILAVLNVGHKTRGKAWVQLPRMPASASLNGEKIGFKQLATNILALQLEFIGEARLEFEL
jgi:alpha-galactosidase